MNTPPYAGLPTLTEAAALLRNGSLSSVALTERCLQQVSTLDPTLHAFVHLDGAAAMDAAHLADRELEAGQDRGLLHGIPIGIKDVIDVRDQPTTAQSLQLRDYVPRRNATVVDRLVASGAVLMGKLTTHEFAFGAPEHDGPAPPARNPWNPAHFAGGSSSGAAVAVASGMVLGAIGTDTAGSIRSPAALCGVSGFKPVRSWVPSRGVLPLSPSLDTLGVIAREPIDCAAMFSALRSGSLDVIRGGGDLHIGIISHFHESDQPVSAIQRVALVRAASALEMLGAQVRELVLPSLQQWQAAGMVTLLSEAYALHGQWLKESAQLYGASFRNSVSLGALLDNSDQARARGLSARLREHTRAALRGVDLLLTAIQPGPAKELDQVEPLGFLGGASYGLPFNIADLPAIALPFGSADGLPLSVQLACAPGQESTLLQTAQRLMGTALKEVVQPA
jgi:aspartyl-tRNA(Asn)/glutamyl-tRNA(Gln) amidotransferase subunit A